MEKQTSDLGVEEIWVNVSEGAEISGYNSDHVRLLARNNWKLAEADRFIKIRKRSNGYDIWLPDLMRYKLEVGRGPHDKNSSD
ncbi:MAG: hypothetical protein ABI690_04855 [Chloroflexota bacterium]